MVGMVWWMYWWMYWRMYWWMVPWWQLAESIGATLAPDLLLCSVQCSSTSSPTLPSILPSHPPLPCLPLSRELSDGSPHLASYSVILLNEDYPPIPPSYQQVLHPELKAKPHFHHCLEQVKHRAPLWEQNVQRQRVPISFSMTYTFTS